MFMPQKVVLLISSFLLFHNVYSTNIDSSKIAIVQKYCDSLLTDFNKMSLTSNENSKLLINQDLNNHLYQALKIRESFFYSFDTLKYLGHITSDDGLMKVYTYNIPLAYGTHKYFGFIQLYHKKEDTVYLYKLTDADLNPSELESQSIPLNKWYGALYYQVISKKIKGEKYYHLLGIDFNDILTSKKIIDVLYFNQFGELTLGKPIFEYNNQLKYRVVFEYSARVAMLLTYDERLDMITFDHLSPFQPSLTGNFQFYGPDLSYDGFEFDKTRWLHRSNIDVRNEY